MRHAGLVLVALLGGASPAAADVTLLADAPASCPSAPWFSQEGANRGVHSAVIVDIHEDERGFIGRIRLLEDAAPIEREVRSPTCASVAESLLLIAEIHDRRLPSAAGTEAPSRPAPATPRALAPTLPQVRRSPELRLFSGGVAISGDTVVAGALTPGISVFARLTPPASIAPLGGWVALSGGYLRGTSDMAGVAILQERLRGRLDVVPVALPVGEGNRLGVAAVFSGARLRVRADVPNATDDARSLVEVGVGPRVLTLLGPASLELGIDLSFPLTRRAFVLPDRDAPVFRLPTAALSAFVALGTR